MENKLQFKNRKFKIMLVGDPHCQPEDGTPKAKEIIKDYLAFQYAALQREQPDLVVLMGDNADGEEEEALRKTLLRITKPYADTNTPFSFILGNHDLQNGNVTSLHAQYKIYNSLPCCALPDTYTDAGDYELLVRDSTGRLPALQLLHVYSGSGGSKADQSYYDHVKPEQNAWIKERCAQIKKAAGKVPAVLFQHIPMPEVFDLLEETSFLSMAADGVTGQNEQKSRFFRLKRSTGGYMGEAPCPPAVNSGEFQAIRETESIFAAFFGHDHMNDFLGMTQGILLGQCKLASFNAYGDGLMQGVRILEFDEDAPFTMETRMLYYRDIFGDQCRSISGSLKTMRDRTSVKLETSLKALGVLSAVSVPLLLMIKRMK